MKQSQIGDSAAYRLRGTTRSFHDMVDATYSRFDLGQPDDYRSFLLAHAQATSAAEASLDGDAALPAWRPRTPLVADDLRQLGLAMPAALPFGGPDDGAWRWGVLYVLEGSRLGGGMLVDRTPAGAPARFLADRHHKGEWRLLLEAIDAQSRASGAGWTDAAVVGACDCFELYRRAAGDTGVRPL